MFIYPAEAAHEAHTRKSHEALIDGQEVSIDLYGIAVAIVRKEHLDAVQLMIYLFDNGSVPAIVFTVLGYAHLAYFGLAQINNCRRAQNA